MSRKARLLFDECLHTSLVQVATDLGYEAYHVAYLGMAGLKDHELMLKIRESEYTFVTNNAIDFRRLFKNESLNSGLVIIVPNVRPDLQRDLLKAALDHIANRDLINTAIEVDIDGANTVVQEFEIPPPSK